MNVRDSTKPALRAPGPHRDTGRSRGDGGIDLDIAARLQAWDGEGGAESAPSLQVPPGAAPLTAQQHRLLARLGSALVQEWGHLPMPLQRAIYRRAVRGALDADPSVLARPMALFLHDRRETWSH